MTTIFGFSHVLAQGDAETTTKRTVATTPNVSLRGPAAKNRKVWKTNNRKKQRVVTASSDEKVRGPKAKNQKPFVSQPEATYQEVKVDNTKKGLKGPKAKNYKPLRPEKESKEEIKQQKVEDTYLLESRK
ncbi:MAG: hypothetical protein AAGA66_19040 [Bacteroidota bacterium]